LSPVDVIGSTRPLNVNLGDGKTVKNVNTPVNRPGTNSPLSLNTTPDAKNSNATPTLNANAGRNANASNNTNLSENVNDTVIPDDPSDQYPSDYWSYEKITERFCARFGVSEEAVCARLVRKLITANYPDCSAELYGTLRTCNDRLLVLYRDAYCAKHQAEASSCLQLLYNKAPTDLRFEETTYFQSMAILTGRFQGFFLADLTTQDTLDAKTQSDGPLRLSELFLNEAGLGLPFEKPNEAPLALLPSVATLGLPSNPVFSLALPYVSFLDADGDQAPDDLERILGTDPARLDSDGDSYADGEELRSGHDPLNPIPDTANSTLNPTATALLSGALLGQPANQGTLDSSLTLSPATTATKGRLRLTGQGDPNSLLLVYLYSKLPLVLTVQTNASGQWTYELSEPLTENLHTAYVAVANGDGTIARKSSALQFFVKKAEAVTVTSFLSDEPIVETSDAVESPMRSYLLAGGALILIGLILVGFFYFIRRNSNAGA
jgi:hypothetical protein